MTILALITAGSFEWVRETARRPWVIYGYMYSNGITKEVGARLDAQGVLAVSGWAELRAGGMSFAGKPNDEPKAAAPSEGAEAKKPLNLKILSAEQKAAFGDHLFAMQCSACHGLRGPMLDIRKRVKGLPPAGIDAIIAGQGTVSPYMPPFFGKAEERALLAQRLADLAAEGGDR